LGEKNVSDPVESDLLDLKYNDWVAHKQLAICNEIHGTNNDTAYRNLLTIITEPSVRVREKYMKAYTIKTGFIFLPVQMTRPLLISLISIGDFLFRKLLKKENQRNGGMPLATG